MIFRRNKLDTMHHKTRKQAVTTTSEGLKTIIEAIHAVNDEMVKEKEEYLGP